MRRHFLKLFIISSFVLLAGFSFDVNKGNFQIDNGLFTSLSMFPYESYTFDNIQSINDNSNHDYQFLSFYGFVDNGNKFTIVYEDTSLNEDEIGIINTPNQNIDSKSLDIQSTLEKPSGYSTFHFSSFKWIDEGKKSLSATGDHDLALHNYGNSFDPSTNSLSDTFDGTPVIYSDNLHTFKSVIMCDKKTVLVFDDYKDTIYNFEFSSNYDFSNLTDTNIVDPQIDIKPNVKTSYYPSKNRVLMGQNNTITAYELSCDLDSFEKIGENSYSNNASTNGGETSYSFYSDGEKFIGRSNEFTDVTDFEVFTIDN